MLTVDVVVELNVVEEEFLAEVAPGVGQNFRDFFGARVAMLDMIAQLFEVVDALFADEHGPSRQADAAVGLLVLAFEVAAEALRVWEDLLFLATTTVHGTHQGSEGQTCGQGWLRIVMNGLVFPVSDDVLLAPMRGLKHFPCDFLILGDEHFVELSAANLTLLIVHEEAHAQGAVHTDVFVVAHTYDVLAHGVGAQYAGLVVVQVDHTEGLTDHRGLLADSGANVLNLILHLYHYFINYKNDKR
jgi:hypothetical protein